MLNSKQIYNRINKVFESLFPDHDTYEWWGTDDENVWIFNIPNERTVKMVLDLDTKVVSIYTKPLCKTYDEIFKGGYELVRECK